MREVLRPILELTVVIPGLLLAYFPVKSYLKPVSYTHLIAGQGTIGLEIMDDLPDVDTIVVPIGGGGLASGVASAVKMLHPLSLIHL